MKTSYLKSSTGLALGHFSIEIYASLLIPLYPLITQKLNTNLALISIIIAIVSSSASIIQPYFGFISDKLKHRIFLISGLAAASVFIPISVKFDSIFVFALCLFIGILANAFFHPQASTLMKMFNKNNPDISRMMGLFLGLGSIGYALGPYLGTFFYEKLGFDNLFYISIFGLICAFFIYLYVPKIPVEKSIYEGSFFKVLKEILKNKMCIFLVFLSAVKSAFSVCFGTYVPFLLKDLGFNLTKTGIIVTLFFVAGGCATILSSKIEKCIGSRGTMALSMLAIFPLSICFLYFLKTVPIFAIICFIASGFFAYLSIGVILVLAQQAMPKYTGVISGIIQGTGWGIGGLVLAPAGVVAQIYGINTVLIIISIVALFAGFSCFKARKSQV